MTGPTPRTVTLSAAQLAVLEELCTDGANDETIATRLRISVHTVKSHLKAVHRALGTSNRTAAAVAVLTGAVHVDGKASIAPTDPAAQTVHLGPAPGALLLATGCCHRLTKDLPVRHRITRNPAQVNCGGRA